MKRKIITPLLALIICLLAGQTAFAESKTIVLKIGDPKMTVNGVTQEIDPGRGTKPVTVKQRTLVPIRTIIENIGGSLVWDGSKEQITISANNKTILLTIGVNKAEIKELAAGGDFVSKVLDVAPTVINSRTMVPLRFVSENLGGNVQWEEAAKTVTLTFNTGPVDPYNWTGAWDTTEGIIVFQQIGNKVSSVTDTGGWGSMVGTLSEGTVTGKWHISLESQGDFEITLSEGGKRFTGKWNYDTPSQPFKADLENPTAGWNEFFGERK